MIKRQIKYCSRYFPDSVPKLLEQLLPYLAPGEKEFHHVSGFTHPEVLIYTKQGEEGVEMAKWGLIPAWSKNESDAFEIWNKTINARSESMFEKASFKESSSSKRGIVFVDGFYEHHHKDSKTYPYFIERQDHDMMALACLWSEWLNVKSGEKMKTFTILTCKANKMLQEIHNSPKLNEPRMPVILDPKDFETWMNLDASSEIIVDLCRPVDESLLKSKTVNKLRGKDYLGNVPDITDEKIYPELDENTLF